MNLIDFHCDTLFALDLEGKTGDLYKNNGQVSIENMKKAGTKVQFMALFTDGGESIKAGKDVDPRSLKPGYQEFDACYESVIRKIDYFKEQEAKYTADLAQAKTIQDVEANAKAGKISAILTVEETGIISGDLKRIDTLYEKGVRLMTPMWNYENCIGYPNHMDKDLNARGLKPFGVEAVQKMSELGIIVDVAHASDGCFWDILNYVDGPIVASHSNCRAICPHPRNLTDEMIRALAEKGGLAGLNLFGFFLNEKGRPEGAIDDMVKHIHHMINKGGIEFAAIGTDLDGIGEQHDADIMTVADMPKLWDALVRSGLGENEVEKIWHLNGERIIRGIS